MMKRMAPALGLAAIFIFALFLVTRPTSEAQALPEYSAQTGEPCATCHLSPSGGGSRGPRGQAWVGSGKPGIVPDLIQALELLGVHTEIDQSQYQAVPGSILPAKPLQLKPVQIERFHRFLQEYEGN